MYHEINLICQDIQHRSLSAKTSGKITWKVCTSRRLQLSVLCVAKPTAGILQEISFLICYLGKAICQTTSTPVTMVGSGRQHVCTSAPAAASLTHATASKIRRRWTGWRWSAGSARRSGSPVQHAGIVWPGFKFCKIYLSKVLLSDITIFSMVFRGEPESSQGTTRVTIDVQINILVQDTDAVRVLFKALRVFSEWKCMK